MAPVGEYGAMKPYYEEDGITIYHGDCRELLPGLSADVMITDPPYGYAYESNHVGDTTTAHWMNRQIENDHSEDARDAAIEWATQMPWAVFGTWKCSKPQGTRAVLVWDKGPASGMGDLSFPWKQSWEEIYIGGNGWSGFRDEGVLKGHWIVTRASMGRVHPNEKPVTLIECLAAKAAGTVIDPFMGSGTTLVAAKNLGRKAVGIEIEERYCEIAANRLRQRVLEFA